MLYLVNRLQKEKSIDKANKVEAVKYVILILQKLFKIGNKCINCRCSTI